MSVTAPRNLPGTGDSSGVSRRTILKIRMIKVGSYQITRSIRTSTIALATTKNRTQRQIHIQADDRSGRRIKFATVNEVSRTGGGVPDRSHSIRQLSGVHSAAHSAVDFNHAIQLQFDLYCAHILLVIIIHQMKIYLLLSLYQSYCVFNPLENGARPAA